MFGKYLENVRKNAPLVHSITNYITANDVANILLACGASPIMSDEPEEVEEITSICNGLCINIGTLNQNSIKAMFRAGKKAKTLHHKILLDPVGAGASVLRTRTARDLMNDIHFDVIRGNVSEIKILANQNGTAHGVDADAADTITGENIDRMIVFAKQFAQDCGSVVVITGSTDLISDGKRCYVIHNGRSEMSKITGTGCQLSGMMTAFITANSKDVFGAAAAATAAMGLAGELGWSHMLASEGSSTYRNRIIDAVNLMTDKMLDDGEKYELR